MGGNHLGQRTRDVRRDRCHQRAALFLPSHGCARHLPPMEADPARARRLLETVPVSYVIVDKLDFVDVSRRYARPAVEGDPAHWQVVHAIDGTKIYGRGSSTE